MVSLPKARIERLVPQAAPPGAGKVLVVVGPTAAGKTELGVELAKALHGEIVSADSQQVYRGLEVGTAKPTAGQQMRAPHHLIDVANPMQPLSAGQYQRLADEAIADIQSRNLLPVVVGGTGLWVRALLLGIVEAPPRDDGLRAQWEAKAAREGREALHAELSRLDPETAMTIEPRNLTRTIRALEIHALTGEKPSELRARHSFARLRYHVKMLGVSPPRDELYRRIDARARAIFEQGLVDEVRALSSDRTLNLAGVKAIGYAEALAVVEGRSTVDDAIRVTALKTRHYAKRQLTWFRADPLVSWLSWPPDTDALIDSLNIWVSSQPSESR